MFLAKIERGWQLQIIEVSDMCYLVYLGGEEMRGKAG